MKAMRFVWCLLAVMVFAAYGMTQTAGASAQGQPAPAPAPAAGAPAQQTTYCGNLPLCQETSDFGVIIINFRTSKDQHSGGNIISTTLRFQNKTNQPIILAYVDGSALALDDQGNRYGLAAGGYGLRGMGVINGNNLDPKFMLQPGGVGEAVFQLFWLPRGEIQGSTFELDLTIREANPVAGKQFTLAGEFPLQFLGLVNGAGSTAAPAGAPAGAPQAGYVGSAGAVPGTVVSAPGDVQQVAGAIPGTQAPCDPNASTGTATTGQTASTGTTGGLANAASAISNLGSLFSRKKANAATPAAAAGANPCVPGTTAAATSPTSPTPAVQTATPQAQPAVAGAPAATAPAVRQAVPQVRSATQPSAAAQARSANPPAAAPAARPATATTVSTAAKPAAKPAAPAQPAKVVAKKPATTPPPAKPATTQ